MVLPISMADLGFERCRKLVTFCMPLLLFSGAWTGHAHSNSDPVYKENQFYGNHQTISRISAEGEVVLVYEIQTENHSLGRFNLSPDGSLIALIETKDGTSVGKQYIPPRNRLIICRVDGDVLHTLSQDIRKFSWSPDSKSIAYITGSWSESGRGFTPDSIFIFNIKDSSISTIIKGHPHDVSWPGYSGPGFDVFWSAHDNNVYVAEYDVAGGNYMYDPTTKRTKQVSYKGIHFSPDGKYYLDLHTGEWNHVYESATNNDLTEEVLSIIPSIPYSWIPDRDHHLSSGKTTYADHPKSSKKVDSALKAGAKEIEEKRFYIYDVEKRQIVEEWVEKP